MFSIHGFYKRFHKKLHKRYFWNENPREEVNELINHILALANSRILLPLAI